MITGKQKKAVKLTLENMARKKPLTGKEIVAEAGYGEVIQNNPKQVFESKGFKELMAEHIPDKLLVKKHLYLLSDKRKEETQVKALDMAYKIRGDYPKEQSNNFQFNFGEIKQKYE
jgi:hypothetical protein